MELSAALFLHMIMSPRCFLSPAAPPSCSCITSPWHQITRWQPITAYHAPSALITDVTDTSEYLIMKLAPFVTSWRLHHAFCFSITVFFLRLTGFILCKTLPESRKQRQKQVIVEKRWLLQSCGSSEGNMSINQPHHRISGVFGVSYPSETLKCIKKTMISSVHIHESVFSTDHLTCLSSIMLLLTHWAWDMQASMYPSVHPSILTFF